MPIAEGAVTDLFDRPLFFSLYDWFLEVLNLFSYPLFNVGLGISVVVCENMLFACIAEFVDFITLVSTLLSQSHF